MSINSDQGDREKKTKYFGPFQLYHWEEPCDILGDICKPFVRRFGYERLLCYVLREGSKPVQMSRGKVNLGMKYFQAMYSVMARCVFNSIVPPT